MTGSSATDVCLSAGAACISFLCLPCTATDLPSGECGGGGGGGRGGGRARVCVYAREGDRQGEREERDSKTRCTLSHAVIHLLVHCEQTHTKAHAHAHACTHKHLHVKHTRTSLLPRRPRGQWDRASLRVWFVCLHLIIETGLFLQPLLRLFYILTRAREREK